MEVKEALQRFRKRESLTQQKMAARIGITQAAYSQYEAGTATPPVKVLIKMAEAFNVTTDYLLGLSDAPYPVRFNEQEVLEVRLGNRIVRFDMAALMEALQLRDVLKPFLKN